MSLMEDLKTEEKDSTTPHSDKKWTDTFKPKNGAPTGGNSDVDLIAKLTEENNALKDKILRSLAEVENTRRICEEEKNKTMKFAITNIAKDLIVVMDNFYRAFDSLEGNNDDLKAFLQGMELNFSEFKRVFDKYNIKRIFPIDEDFDPALHQAISQVESDKNTGTVVEVLQAGYSLNDRVIKPALVVVAK